MSSAVPDPRGGERVEQSLVVDFAWAIAGGLVLLAASVVVYTLAVTWGGLPVGTPMPGGGPAPISMHYPQFAALFLGGFLVVLVARGVSARAY